MTSTGWTRPQKRKTEYNNGTIYEPTVLLHSFILMPLCEVQFSLHFPLVICFPTEVALLSVFGDFFSSPERKLAIILISE